MPTMRTLNAQGNLYAGTPAPPVRCSRSMDSPAMKPVALIPGWTNSVNVATAAPTSHPLSNTKRVATTTVPARITGNPSGPLRGHTHVPMTSTSHPSDTTSAQRQEGHNSMQIIRPSQHPPSPLPPDTGSPPPSLPATPRPRALAIIEHALRRGDILEIGTTTIRYLRQGRNFRNTRTGLKPSRLDSINAMPSSKPAKPWMAHQITRPGSTSRI